MSTYAFFFRKQSPFSNFYPVTYQIDGKMFKSSEQGFMYEKAIFFNDLDIAKAIRSNKS